MECSLLNVQVSMMHTLSYCNYLLESHWEISIKKQFVLQFSGGACNQNNRFGQSDSSSGTHAQKTKTFEPNFFIGDCVNHHLSDRPSYVTLKYEKHAITVLRYMFGSVYFSYPECKNCLLPPVNARNSSRCRVVENKDLLVASLFEYLDTRS